ncbi:unnamed protein product, partial [Porites evermanni]
MDIRDYCLSAAGFCNFYVCNVFSKYYGDYCNQPIFLRSKTNEVHCFIQKTKNFVVHCGSMVYGSHWLSASPNFSDRRYTFQPGKAMCMYPFQTNIAYTVFIECVFVAAPFTLITFCYAKVFYTVSRSNRVFTQENNPEQLRANVEEVEVKVTKTLDLVMASSPLCWLPICIMDYIDAARGEPTLPRQVYLTYGFLAYLSSTINPFKYGATNRRFRREYKTILKKISLIFTFGRCS